MGNASTGQFSWQGIPVPLEESLQWEVPMVEVFETVEGEGLKAGYPTIFVRLFHCNLRCRWCDTPYSYAPSKPEYNTTIGALLQEVKQFASKHLCLTGGEPLIHREKSAAIIHHFSLLENIEDIHIETNGAINLQPFIQLRNSLPSWQSKVRFIMDFKLPSSGELERMVTSNFEALSDQDEIKFVIGSDDDFETALETIHRFYQRGHILMSPVWEEFSPRKLVEKVLAHGLSQVKISLQLHKIIWDPDQRGV